jgi:predicted histidine transporter YuiF (NhaC family)
VSSFKQKPDRHTFVITIDTFLDILHVQLTNSYITLWNENGNIFDQIIHNSEDRHRILNTIKSEAELIHGIYMIFYKVVVGYMCSCFSDYLCF